MSGLIRVFALAGATLSFSACALGSPTGTMSRASVQPVDTVQASTIPVETPTSTIDPAPPPSDPAASYAPCRPGPMLGATPQPGQTAAPGRDPDALVPCGREEWRSALQPVVRAVDRAKRNFAGSYFIPPDGGRWQMFINFVKDGDAPARARVESLIQEGAPVHWREVKYSMAELEETMDGPLLNVLGPFMAAGDKVLSWFIDVKNNAIQITTRGPQPEVETALMERFGDLVRIEEGPAELPPPI